MGAPPAAAVATATSTTRRDVLSAYAASLTKIGAWAAVSAIVYRRMGPIDFAMLALIRSTIGLLNYTSLGIGPALVHHLARFRVQTVPARPLEDGPVEQPGVLAYARPATDQDVEPNEPSPAQQTYTTGIVATLFVFVIGAILLIGLPVRANDWLKIPTEYRQVIPDLILTMGFGVLARILSEPAGAALQTFGRIALDNALLATTDVLWVMLFAFSASPGSAVNQAGTTFLWANLFLLLARYTFAHRHLPIGVGRVPIEPKTATSLLAYGALLTLAQLADFLYAPTDYLLINALLSTRELAAYAPCVQIDAGLLLLVTGLSATLFPKAALAHARGDAAALERYYLRGTLLSTGVLLAASVATYLAAPLLLRLWLGEIPPGTLAILPLVLLNTTAGGSSAVARSILLGAGRVRSFTAAVLISGAVNVAVSYLLVRYTSLGLYGIVLGTLVAVTLRCLIWMPWYTARVIRQTAQVKAV